LILRKLVVAAVCVAALVAAGFVGAGCSDDSTEGEGVTNLEDVGPDINRLEAEVTALVEQVRDLETRVAELETNNPPPLR
jgi:outer membrane murein-binding lipoprotein Lpp